uniref:Uncharacterized protein n=1 Tax=mine drainage metagenome TaxID=410659 RepID=E6QP79_9ZZZZ
MAEKTLGRLQKGTTGSLEFGIYGFNGGLNVKSVPQQVGDNDLTVALNVYLSTSGGVRMRNGITKHGASLGASPVIGLVRFFQTINAGLPVSPPTVATLAQVGGNLYNADTATPIGSIGGTTAAPMVTARAQDANDPHIAGLTDVLVICTGSGGPYVYDGANLYTPAGWADAASAAWCTIVNGVVWFGGIPGNPRTVYGTGDGIVTSFESLPGYNVFLMSHPVTGLCTLGNGASSTLVVGMITGIATISGTGPNNYVLQEIPSVDGVAAGRTMVTYDGLPGSSMFTDPGVLFFLGRSGVYQFNGYSPPSQMSIKVEPWILNDPYVPGYPMSENRNLSFSWVYNNRLHIAYCSNSFVPNTILVFDFIVGGWTVLQPTPGMSSATLLDAPGDPAPSPCVVGSSTSGQLYNWDIEPGAGNVATDDGATIQTAFQTKYFPLGVPGTNKMLTRAYPEFFLTGPIQGNFYAQTDYGNIVNAHLLATTPQTGYLWDVGQWDQAIWSANLVFQPYGPPASRVDFDETQGNTFAFGVTTSGGTAPYIFGGMTGVFKQLGRSSAA